MSDYWEENGIEKPQQIVVCAANKVGDVILRGARHWDSVMRKQADLIGIKGGTEKQGFIDQFGDFLTREEALDIVLKNNQSLRTSRGELPPEGSLFSEDLY